MYRATNAFRETAHIIAKRDSANLADTSAELASILEDIEDMLADGQVFEVDDYWMDHTGLEPDYLINILHEGGCI